MSRLATGILGATALSLSFGAAQFALGRDLPVTAAEPAAGTVNRAAKADRVASIAGSPVQTQTVSVGLEGSSNISFLVRVPIASGTSRSSMPPVTRPGVRRSMVACEPVVSVLTEVARLLPPGRCVT
jgi:hypothetical protein